MSKKTYVKLRTDLSKYITGKPEKGKVRMKFKLPLGVWNKYVSAHHDLTQMVTVFPQCGKTDAALKMLERIQTVLDYYYEDLDTCMVEIRGGKHEASEEKDS